MNKNRKIKKQSLGIFFILFIVLAVYVIIATLFIYYFSAGVAVLSVGILINLYFSYKQTKSPRATKNSKTSWFLFLLITPYSGSFIYLVAGNLPKKKLNTLKDFYLYQKQIFDEFKIKQNDDSKSNDFSIRKTYTNFECKLIKNGPEQFKRLFRDLSSAKKAIYIESFIINDGIIWRNILNILIQKKIEGLDIKILTDYIGNIQTSDYAYKLLKDYNIDFVQHNKFSTPFTSGYSNLRNHNKFFIIDYEYAYTGGLNIGDDYAHLYSKYGFWADCNFYLKGEIVNEIIAQFAIDWYKATNEDIWKKIKLKLMFSRQKVTNEILKTKKQIKMFSDGPEFKDFVFLNVLIKFIQKSKNTIKIVTPYAIIPHKLQEEIFKAKKRGVDIQVFTTGKPDKKLAYFAGKYYLEKLKSENIEVFRSENYFNHSKLYVFDDELVIFGTSNIDSRSLFLHWESNFVIQDKMFTNDANDFINEIKRNSYNEDRSMSDWTIFTKMKNLFLVWISPFL